MNAGSLTVSIRKKLTEFELHLEHEFSTGITAIVGPSGAGKTTLLNILSGIAKPDGGTIRIGNEIIYDSQRGIWIKPRYRRLGYVFQDVRLFPHLTVEENIRFPLSFLSVPRAHYSVADIVQATGIRHLLNRYPGQLSGGEQQRVALARALLGYPRWLLLDEPMGALDIGSKLEFLYFLSRIHRQFQLPILIVSHDLNTVLSFSHEVLFLKQGKVIAAGKPFQVVARVLQQLETRSGIELSVDLQPNYHNLLTAKALQMDPEKECLIVGDAHWQVYLPQTQLPLQSELLLHIPSNEIILATELPRQISANTILKGNITNLEYVRNRVFVTVNCGVPLVAEIVPGTVKRLQLHEGQSVFLILKATSIRILNVGTNQEKTEIQPS